MSKFGNFGWGEEEHVKWIYTLDGDPYHSAFSAYTFRLEDEEPWCEDPDETICSAGEECCLSYEECCGIDSSSSSYCSIDCTI